jgi:hypothetical protein
MAAMTFDAGGPLARRQAAIARQRRTPVRWWLVGVLAVLILLLLAGNGGRAWWARRVGDVTSGTWGWDYLIGLGVGLIPLLAVAAAGLGRQQRRPGRVFLAGAAGFVIIDLLAPSLVTAIRHNGGAATRPFEQHAPGYLPGVYTGVLLWLVLVVYVIVRIRQAWRRRIQFLGGGTTKM